MAPPGFPPFPHDVTLVFIFVVPPRTFFQSRLQKVDPFALQEGDGREVGGEKPRLPWSSPPHSGFG